MLGALGIFAYNLFFMGALERLPASRAALIIALNPIVTITISAVVLKERLGARRWLGVAIALLGVWIVDLAWRLRASRLCRHRRG